MRASKARGQEKLPNLTPSRIRDGFDPKCQSDSSLKEVKFQKKKYVYKFYILDTGRVDVGGRRIRGNKGGSRKIGRTG